MNERHRYSAMLAAGLVLSACGGLLQLYAGHGVLMGLFGTSCMYSPIMTYVSRWFDRSRGAAVALISSGQSLAGAFWPIVFQAGITEFGWRRTMLVFGLFVGATILVLAAIFLRPPGLFPGLPRRQFGRLRCRRFLRRARRGRGRDRATPPRVCPSMLVWRRRRCGRFD